MTASISYINLSWAVVGIIDKDVHNSLQSMKRPEEPIEVTIERYVVGPFVALCGLLSYELYLVHMQMLENVGAYATSALMIILLSLLISYSMHYVMQILQKQ